MAAKARQSRPKLLQAMIDAFSLPDLRRRLLFTFGILVVFRFIAHVPLPGVDLQALSDLFARNQLMGMLDLFSGGALKYFSVAAMGVYPYITSTIIMQLLVPVIPGLQALYKEGEAGRNKINMYTHWLTVPLAMLQAFGQLVILSREGVVSGIGLSGSNFLPTLAMIISMTAGTIFLVWLGELITGYGIGNGVSLIIFAGIVAGYPEQIGRTMLAGENIAGLIAFAVLSIATIAAIVIFTEAHRRIPVQYARSTFRGGRMYRQSGGTHIPIRVNSAGMIPLIFAISIMLLPGTIASWFTGNTGFVGSVANFIINNFGMNDISYQIVYFLLVFGFAFFYTMVIFQQQNLADVLQKQGGFIPGIRPGRSTAEYLNKVINRITWGGAIFLAVIAIMPFIAQRATNLVVLQLSGIGLLIVVGVLLDTMKQLEAQLLMRRYEGFIR